MILLPAIDLMKGQAVRLVQGDRTRRKTYGWALDVAYRYAEVVDEIHIVDLDGAFTGEPKNLDTVSEIIQKTHLTVQLGGGFRSNDSIQKAIDRGVNRVLIGTQAVEPRTVFQMEQAFPGKIAVSIDLRGGRMMLEGWEQPSDVPWKDLFHSLQGVISWFVMTNVDLDGTLSGSKPFQPFWNQEKVIYAGGVSNLDDLDRLRSMGYYGAISGKAIIEGHLNLKEAVAFLRQGG